MGNRLLREPYRLLNIFVGKCKQSHEMLDAERLRLIALVNEAKDHLAKMKFAKRKRQATLALLYELLEQVELEAQADRVNAEAYGWAADEFRRIAILAIGEFTTPHIQDALFMQANGNGATNDRAGTATNGNAWHQEKPGKEQQPIQRATASGIN